MNITLGCDQQGCHSADRGAVAQELDNLQIPDMCGSSPECAVAFGAAWCLRHSPNNNTQDVEFEMHKVSKL